MSPIVILTQVVLPFALLIWLAWHPTSGKLGYVLHVAATGAILLALMVVGLWAFPPFWMPWLLICTEI